MRERPTHFSLTAIVDGIRHEYSASINDDVVLEEHAYAYPEGRARRLFSRDGDGLRLGPSTDLRRGRAALDLLRPNALFLSTAATGGHPELSRLYRWFAGNLGAVQTYLPMDRRSKALLADPNRREEVLSFLRAADLGITDARVRDLSPEDRARVKKIVGSLADEIPSDVADELMQQLPPGAVEFSHRGIDGFETFFPPGTESQGTGVWFSMIGVILDALSTGSVLVIDELDGSLHPTMVREVVRIFQEPDTNPHGAQLIFTTHDVTLMETDASGRLLGRDQIWLTEKNTEGASSIYPLSALAPRKSEAVAQRYLAGRYGAVPIISSADLATSLWG